MDLICNCIDCLAFLGGALGGMCPVRKQIEKFADNPRLNAEAVRTLSANGLKRS